MQYVVNKRARHEKSATTREAETETLRINCPQRHTVMLRWCSSEGDDEVAGSSLTQCAVELLRQWENCLCQRAVGVFICIRAKYSEGSCALQ